ncbi:MAG: hypothetical protein AAF975_07350 [Spirochaetota bacterium]
MKNKMITSLLYGCVAVLLLVSCATLGQGSQGPKNKHKTAKIDYTFVDTKGAAFMDQAYPDWVVETEPGMLYSKKEIKKRSFDGDEFWIITVNGVNLEILKEYANGVDVQVEVAKQFSSGVDVQVEVAKQFSSGAKMSSETALSTEGRSAAEAEAVGEFVKNAFANATFSGLTKDRDWWVKKRFSDGREEYEYKVIYTLDKDSYRRQRDAYLKKLLNQLPKDSTIDPEAIGLAIDYIRKNDAAAPAPKMSKDEMASLPGMEEVISKLEEESPPEEPLSNGIGLPENVKNIVTSIAKLEKNPSLSPEDASVNQEAKTLFKQFQKAVASGTSFYGEDYRNTLPKVASQLVGELEDIGWYGLLAKY